MRACLVLLIAAAAPAIAQSYDFQSTALSGVTGTVDFSVATTGTLIGDWDADTNPSGTRTKPGLFGSFGSTENVAVPVDLGVGLGGTIDSASQSAFNLNLNTGAGTALISGYSADLLSGGPVALPASIMLAFETFRTANPDSLYLGVPLDVPFGELSLASLSATQIGPAAPGALSPLGGGVYDLSLAVPVIIEAQFEGLGGQMFDIGPLPFLLPIDGQLEVAGQTASLTATAALDLAETFDAGVALPQFPLGLPTVLPPGETANLLFDLMLGEIGLNLDLTSTLNANGTLVPAPSVVGVLAMGGLISHRRRRSVTR